MSREITSAAQGASQAQVARPVLLAELDFPSGFVRVNSTDRGIFFDSQGASPLNEFLGVGRLGSISTMGETSDLQARGVELTLSGIPSAHVSAAFESAQGRPGRIWIGFLDDSYALVVEPVLVFSGLIDNSNVNIGETATVTVTVESRLIAWERPKIRRYTNEDQQQRFSGESPTITDKFLEFVNQTVDKELLWGVAGDGAPRSVSTGESEPVAGETVTFRGETFFVPDDAGGGAGTGGGGSSGGGACCFVAGTLVMMADGTTKRIEDVEIGEKVRGLGRINTVVGLNRPMLQQRPLIAFNDTEPFTTWDHPFWDNEEGVWRCVSPQHRKKTASLIIKPLQIGSKIATTEGDVEIAAIKRVAADPETQLYDIRLDGDHAYLADGFLVHNC